MDNFEHVIAGRIVGAGNSGSRALVKMVVTSREKLSLNAETVFVLSGMEFPTGRHPPTRSNTARLSCLCKVPAASAGL